MESAAPSESLEHSLKSLVFPGAEQGDWVCSVAVTWIKCPAPAIWAKRFLAVLQDSAAAVKGGVPPLDVDDKVARIHLIPTMATNFADCAPAKRDLAQRLTNLSRGQLWQWGAVSSHGSHLRYS